MTAKGDQTMWRAISNVLARRRRWTEARARATPPIPFQAAMTPRHVGDAVPLMRDQRSTKAVMRMCTGRRAKRRGPGMFFMNVQMLLRAP